MTNEKLIIGDVVTLKSGGPCMTIRRIVDLDDDNIWVTWFVDGISHFAAFPEVVLVKQQTVNYEKHVDDKENVIYPICPTSDNSYNLDLI